MPDERELWLEVFDGGDCATLRSRGADDNAALGLLEQFDAIGKPAVRVALALDADRCPVNLDDHGDVNLYGHGDVDSGRVDNLNRCGRVGAPQQRKNLLECCALANIGRAFQSENVFGFHKVASVLPGSSTMRSGQCCGGE